MAGQALSAPDKAPEKAEEPRVNPLPTEDQIRQRAHEIYLERGATEGKDVDDWLAAEAELRRKMGEQL